MVQGLGENRKKKQKKTELDHPQSFARYVYSRNDCAVYECTIEPEKLDGAPQFFCSVYFRVKKNEPEYIFKHKATKAYKVAFLQIKEMKNAVRTFGKRVEKYRVHTIRGREFFIERTPWASFDKQFNKRKIELL